VERSRPQPRRQYQEHKKKSAQEELWEKAKDRRPAITTNTCRLANLIRKLLLLLRHTPQRTAATVAASRQQLQRLTAGVRYLRGTFTEQQGQSSTALKTWTNLKQRLGLKTKQSLLETADV